MEKYILMESEDGVLSTSVAEPPRNGHDKTGFKVASIPIETIQKRL